MDQYLAILYPLEYSAKVTRLMSWLLIALVWGLGALASVLGGLKLASARSPWASCRLALGGADSGDGGGVPPRWWLAGINAALYVLPLCLLSFIYLRIFFVARKNSRKIRRKNTSSVRMNAEALSGGYVEYDEDNGGCGDNPEMEMTSSVAAMRKASYEFSITLGSGGGKAEGRRGRKKKRVVSVPSMSCPAVVLDETSLSNQLAPPHRHRRKTTNGASNGHAGLDATVSCPVKKSRIKKPRLRYNKSLASAASASSKESSVDLESSVCSLTPTPKRKCSFSSYSECRLLEEEGEGTDCPSKHQGLIQCMHSPSLWNTSHLLLMK